jgi:hypothetical protein
MCTSWLSKWTYQLSKVELAKWWSVCGCRLLAKWTWENKECQLSKIAEQMVFNIYALFSLGSSKLDKLGLHLWPELHKYLHFLKRNLVLWFTSHMFVMTLRLLKDCIYLMPSGVVSKWSFCVLNCISNYSSCYKKFLD